MRFVLAFLAFMAPAAAFAQCSPPNAGAGTMGCQPSLGAPQSTDLLLGWRPSAFPSSAGTLTVGGLFSGLIPFTGPITAPSATFTGSGTALTVTNNASFGSLSIGHIISTGTIPVASACGTSPTVVTGSTDTGGSVTEGTTATGCTVTFATAYATAPFCVVSSPNGAPFTSYTASTTALTIVNASASGDDFTWVCLQ